MVFSCLTASTRDLRKYMGCFSQYLALSLSIHHPHICTDIKRWFPACVQTRITKYTNPRRHRGTHTHAHPANAHTSLPAERKETGVERDDMGKDFKKQLLSVFCKKRLRLDSCQGDAIEWFHQTESEYVCICACNYFMYVALNLCAERRGDHCRVCAQAVMHAMLHVKEYSHVWRPSISQSKRTSSHTLRIKHESDSEREQE